MSCSSTVPALLYAFAQPLIIILIQIKSPYVGLELNNIDIRKIHVYRWDTLPFPASLTQVVYEVRTHERASDYHRLDLVIVYSNANHVSDTVTTYTRTRFPLSKDIIEVLNQFIQNDRKIVISFWKTSQLVQIIVLQIVLVHWNMGCLLTERLEIHSNEEQIKQSPPSRKIKSKKSRFSSNTPENVNPTRNY